MLVSFSEAAAALGMRSRSSLYRLAKDGRLAPYLRPGEAGGPQLLELEPPGLPSLRDWLRGGALREQSNSPTARQSPTASPPAPLADPAAVAQGLAALVQGLPEDAIPALPVSRERREHYQAELSRLQALRERGELIPAADVKAEAFALGRQIRDAMRSIPQRIAPLLAATADPREVHRLLADEIDVALRGLAEA